MRDFLKKQTGKQFDFGTYGIKIEKVADAKVSFIENFNGIQFRQNYFKIEEAAKYFEWKTKQLLPELSKQRKEVDLTKATQEFKNQHKSHQELLQILTIFIYDLILESEENRCNIDFSEDSYVSLKYTNGQVIDVKIRQNDMFPFVTLDARDNDIYDKDGIVPHITYGNILNRILEEIEFKREQTLVELLSLYRMQKAQLAKFKTTYNENAEFPLTNEEIMNFVNNADNGDELVIELQTLQGRKRTFHVVRQTRVKYLLEIRNFEEDGTMQEEYWLHVTKFSSDFTKNIELLKTIYNTFA